MQYAFRCKTCGHLEGSDHAAEAPHPHSCRVCGEGVEFHRKTGVKTLLTDNWEVLEQSTPERLTELGLTKEHVCCHTPRPASKPGHVPQNIAVSATEGTTVKDVAH